MAELVMALGNGDGTTAAFEVDGEQLGSDLDLAAGGDGVAARAQMTLQEALDRVRPALGQVAAAVRELKPDEAEIEFGLKVGGETGVIIAKGTAEVNFAIRMVWKSS
ncbi:CU044_2847 family protein [Streptomyces sp. NPDC087300]|uniref:CU044_2847 family protein n=1 Tax=Streptomyces sp. NPDC087300 TaxID=3365780 RepID=UPI00382400B3